MAASIADIQAEMETAIKAATPDFRSNIPYTLAPKMAPLVELSATAKSSRVTREFQVVPMPEHVAINYNLTLVRLDQIVRVSLRYYVPPVDTGYIDLALMVATDTARISKTLATRQWSGSPGVGMCDFRAAEEETLGEEHTIHILHLDFVVRYFLGDV